MQHLTEIFVPWDPATAKLCTATQAACLNPRSNLVPTVTCRWGRAPWDVSSLSHQALCLQPPLAAWGARASAALTALQLHPQPQGMASHVIASHQEYQLLPGVLHTMPFHPSTLPRTAYHHCQPGPTRATRHTSPAHMVSPTVWGGPFPPWPLPPALFPPRPAMVPWSPSSLPTACRELGNSAKFYFHAPAARQV